MRISIDVENNELSIGDNNTLNLYTKEAFKIISDIWLKLGWDQKYMYGFTWMGRPIIQLPEDIIRVQETVYAVSPDIIIETGIAHGGSLIFYASLCRSVGKGRVLGIDIDIRSHNRDAIEKHELFDLITLIEGSSIDTDKYNEVSKHINPGESVMVILDSCHDYEHVLKELELYSKLVTVGSYIIATDGSQEYLGDTPRALREYPGAPGWKDNNPKRAIIDFINNNRDFRIEEKFPFNEGNIDFRITHWPSAYIKRVS